MELGYPAGFAMLAAISIFCGILCDIVILPTTASRRYNHDKPRDYVYKYNGWVRSCAALVIIVLFQLCPCVFPSSRPIGRMIAAAVLMWWGTFKIIAALMGRGPLLSSQSSAESILVLCLPVTRARDERYSKDTQKQPEKHAMLSGVHAIVLAVLKFAAVCALIYIDRVVTYRLPGISLQAQSHVIYMLLVYFFASLMMDFPASLLLLCTGIHLSQHFNQPYLSVSFTDFWSGRWNLTAGSLLRAAVYEPTLDVLSGRSLIRSGAVGANHRSHGSHAAKLVAVGLTFAVSGLAHEEILWFVDSTGTWEWFWFFELQTVFVVIESFCLYNWHYDMCKRSVVYGLMSRIITMSVFLWVAELYFWPPVEKSGLDQRLLHEWATLLNLA